MNRSREPLPSRLRRAALGLLVAGGSLVAAAVLAELLWRFLRVRSWVPASPFVMAWDEELGWGYQPETRVRHRTEEFDVEVRFDAHGRRVGEEDAPPCAPLALFVGDSLTLGWGVAEEETFASRVGEALGLRMANLGVAGYGTDQCYLKLRRDGLPLRPSLVVYTFSPNDLVEVLHGKRYGRAKPRFRLEGDQLVLSPARERSRFLERHSSLYGSWQSFLQGRTPATLTSGQVREVRRLITRLIRAMAADSRAAGATFVLVTAHQPWLHEAVDGQPRAVRVDAGPALDRTVREGGPVRFTRDPHWNAPAHGVVAEEIVATLRTTGLGRVEGAP
jgi:hypothetical protein